MIPGKGRQHKDGQGADLPHCSVGHFISIVDGRLLFRNHPAEWRLIFLAPYTRRMEPPSATIYYRGGGPVPG